MSTHLLDANGGQFRIREGHDQSLPISQTNRILTLAAALQRVHIKSAEREEIADVLRGIQGINALNIGSSDSLAPFTPAGATHRSDLVVALWRVLDLDSHERISNIEELEFPEIYIGSV